MTLCRLFGTGSLAYLKGNKGFSYQPSEKNYIDGTIEDVKRASAASEFGEAKSFLERFEQVERKNAEIDELASQE